MFYLCSCWWLNRPNSFAVFTCPTIANRMYKNPPLVPVLTHANSATLLQPMEDKFFTYSSHLCLCLPSGIFPSNFQTKFPLWPFSSLPRRLIQSDITRSLVIILKTYIEERKLWSCSLTVPVEYP